MENNSFLLILARKTAFSLSEIRNSDTRNRQQQIQR